MFSLQILWFVKGQVEQSLYVTPGIGEHLHSATFLRISRIGDRFFSLSGKQNRGQIFFSLLPDFCHVTKTDLL